MLLTCKRNRNTSIILESNVIYLQKTKYKKWVLESIISIATNIQMVG